MPLEASPIDWISNFLRYEEKPYQTLEIIDKMVANGVAAAGEHSVMTLSAKLRRDNRFQYVPDEGWIARISPDAESVDEITGDQAERIATHMLETMTSGNIATLNHHISIGGIGLPYSVDLEMLRTFKSTYKRLATENEKVRLREAILKEHGSRSRAG